MLIAVQYRIFRSLIQWSYNLQVYISDVDFTNKENTIALAKLII
jgi:hypothetical protein